MFGDSMAGGTLPNDFKHGPFLHAAFFNLRHETQVGNMHGNGKSHAPKELQAHATLSHPTSVNVRGRLKRSARAVQLFGRLDVLETHTLRY